MAAPVALDVRFDFAASDFAFSVPMLVFIAKGFEISIDVGAGDVREIRRSASGEFGAANKN